MERLNIMKTQGRCLPSGLAIPSGIDSSSRLVDEPALHTIWKITTMRIPYSSTLLLLLSALVQYSLQQCYHHDGSIAVHDIQCTEFASGSDSAVPCCEPGRSCLTNGMCSNSATDDNLMQGSCTDKSFESAHCPKFCGGKL